MRRKRSWHGSSTPRGSIISSISFVRAVSVWPFDEHSYCVKLSGPIVNRPRICKMEKLKTARFRLYLLRTITWVTHQRGQYPRSSSSFPTLRVPATPKTIPRRPTYAVTTMAESQRQVRRSKRATGRSSAVRKAEWSDDEPDEAQPAAKRPRTSGAAKDNSNAKKPKQVTRRRAKLGLLPTMPLDVLLEVCLNKWTKYAI